MLLKVEPAQAEVLSRHTVLSKRARGTLHDKWLDVRVVLRSTKLELLTLVKPVAAVVKWCIVHRALGEKASPGQCDAPFRARARSHN